MPRRLPSLNALRTFEAVARLGRMTAAADELCVTHGAVSRQVRALQDELGAALFEDGARQALRLTPAGRSLAAALTPSLDRIAEAVEAVSPSSAPVLDVSCLSTFAMRWLIPRLHRFHARHAGIDVRLSTVSHEVRIERERYDVVIGVEDPRPRWDAAGDAAPAAEVGRGTGADPSRPLRPSTQPPSPSSPNLSPRIETPLQTLLFNEQLGLVLSPALLARVAAPAAPARREALLQRCPRLQTQTRPGAWLDWARASGAELPAGAPEQRFAHYAYTLEAALGGLGLCIAPWHLVADDVAAGRLLAPLGFVDSGLRYTALSRPRASPQALRFCAWLVDEVSQMRAAP